MDTSQNFDYSSAIIGPQFFSPNPAELTVTRIFLRRLKFTDSSGDVVFRTMNLAVINFRKRARLVDASKYPIVSFKKKLFSRNAEWSVYGGESFEAKDLILAVEKTKMFQFKIKLNVFLANNTAKEVCDFRIEGNYFDRSCKIFKGDSDQVVAQMKKEEKLANKIFKRSSYVVSIDPNTDLAFVAVLFAIRHEFYMARKKNRAIVDAILIALH